MIVSDFFRILFYSLTTLLGSTDFIRLFGLFIASFVFAAVLPLLHYFIKGVS